MKKIFIYIILFFSFWNLAEADIWPFYWQWELEIWWNIWFWPSVWWWAYVESANNNNINLNNKALKWFFWIESPVIKEYCSFDDINWTDKAKFSWTWPIYKLNWFAFCEKSWWIAFNPWIVDGMDTQTTYNKDNSTFWWFAWSDALGWLTLSWVTLDTIPPVIDNWVFMATDSKLISDIVSDNLSWNNIVVEIERHNNASLQIHNNTTESHNFQTAKIYDIIATDLSWNESTNTIAVIANLPDFTWNISSNFADDDIMADWIEKFVLDIYLRDQYWNTVKDENISWITRTVELWLTFNNSLEYNSYNLLWESAIKVNWSANIWFWSDTILDYWPILLNYNNSWDYGLEVSSIAPSNAWYSYTSWNINLANIYYKLTWDLDTWNPVNFENLAWTNNLKFIPKHKVTDVTFPANFEVSIDSNFSVDHDFNSPSSFTNFVVYSVLDIIEWWFKNLYTTFQSPIITQTPLSVSWNSYWFSDWALSYSGNALSFWWDIDFSNDWSSNIYFNNRPNNSDSYDFSWLPKSILAAPDTSSQVEYSSIIEYTILWRKVMYPSFTKTDSINIDNPVKIWWLVTDSKNVLERTTKYLKVASWMSKTEIEASVKKNVIRLTSWMASDTTLNWIYYNTLDYTINSWPVWVETIIIKGWNLTISSDINSWINMKWIIVLEDNWNWWDIFIDPSVKNISAAIFTDWNIISWDWTNLSNNINQLYVKWSILSNNTIWWSERTPFVCPYNITCNTEAEAKKYDFNYFRNYVSWWWAPAIWVPVADQSYSFIINYDPRLNNSPPKWFTK